MKESRRSTHMLMFLLNVKLSVYAFLSSPRMSNSVGLQWHQETRMYQAITPGDPEYNITSFLSSGLPSNPFVSTSRPSKADLYGEDELFNLLNVHTQLLNDDQKQKPSEPNDNVNVRFVHESILRSYGDNTMQSLLKLHDQLSDVRNTPLPEPVSPSLHDKIQQAVGEVQENANQLAGSSSSPPSSMDWLDDDTKRTIANIRAIASDVDGTLLTSRQTLHPRTKQAIRRAVESALSPSESNLDWFFPATGKSRKGALSSLGVEIGSLLQQTPGVFLQGLYCVDGQGQVLFEQKLTTAAVAAAEDLASRNGISIVAYDGDSLYSTDCTKAPVVELHQRYGEPMAQPLRKLSEHEPSMHKILLMDDDVHKINTVVRPQLEALANDCGACVTQAIPTMLEWLPEGCSKALGVEKVCQALGIDPRTQLLALGDAENDAGMLQMAAIGVAMGNACPVAKEASDFVMEETNDEGGAGAAMEVFGFGQGVF